MKRHLKLTLAALLVTISWSFAIIAAGYQYPDLYAAWRDAKAKATLAYHVATLRTQPADTQLLIPVDGVRVRDVADTWGDARSGGRSHQGTDIFAERGTPVRSATIGYVVYTGQSELGGNHVYVMGAGGVRYYYAHLDEIDPYARIGAYVSTTSVIGYVGTTGNAETTPPHLHFGMYSRGAQNPYPLLTDRE
jgi:murein DD-endopeptidase MepM/ murein hydrolase activator NlpD